MSRVITIDIMNSINSYIIAVIIASGYDNLDHFFVQLIIPLIFFNGAV